MGSSLRLADEYRRLVEEFMDTGEVGKLVKALIMMPEVVKELIGVELADVRARLTELSGYVRDVKSLVEKLSDSVAELNAKYSELNRRVSRIEVDVGGLVEAILSRVVVEELKSMGYRVKETHRNYRVDEEDIDLLIVAEKDGVEQHFVVEIEVKPTHSDVGLLLSKANLYESRVGVKPKPILAGVWIGREVEVYARSKGVEIFKL